MRGYWRWAIPIALTLLGGGLAFGIYTGTHDVGIALIFVLVPGIGAIAGTLYGRRAPREIVSLLFGMGIGGSAWALIAVTTQPRVELDAFFRAHAFDYIAAAGLAGITLYLVGPDPASAHPRWRDAAAIAILTAIATISAYSSGATPDVLVRTTAGALASSIVAVVLMRALLPSVTNV